MALPTLSKAFHRRVMTDVYLPPEAHRLSIVHDVHTKSRPHSHARCCGSTSGLNIAASSWGLFAHFSCEPNVLILVLVLIGRLINLFP